MWWDAWHVETTFFCVSEMLMLISVRRTSQATKCRKLLEGGEKLERQNLVHSVDSRGTPPTVRTDLKAQGPHLRPGKVNTKRVASILPTVSNLCTPQKRSLRHQ